MSTLITGIRRLINQVTRTRSGRMGLKSLARSRNALEHATHSVVEHLEERQMLSHAAPSSSVYPTIGLYYGATQLTNQNVAYSTTDGTEFGATDLKRPLTETFTIKNTGAGVLDLTSYSRVAVSGANAADFIVTALPSSTVAAGASTQFKVEFAPSVAAQESATLTIDNDTDGSDPFVINLQGTGTVSSAMGMLGNNTAITSGAAATASNYTAFGSIETGSGNISRTFTIKNTGSGNLILSGGTNGLVQVTGANASEFGITEPVSSTIAPNATETFSVLFTPAGATGTQTAALSIPTNDTNHATFLVNISGVGQDLPIMHVQGFNGTVAAAVTNGESTPTATDGSLFGNVNIIPNVSVTRTFVIQNTGTAPLSLSGSPAIAISGAGASFYTVVSQPSSSLSASGTVAVQIRFTPTAVATENATVSITNNDALTGTNHAFTFALSGSGVAAPSEQVYGPATNSVAISSGDTNLATLDGTQFGGIDINGAGISETFTIKNLGSTNLNLTGTNGLVSISGDTADFTVTQQPLATIPLGDTPHAAPAPRTAHRRVGTRGPARGHHARVSAELAPRHAHDPLHSEKVAGARATAPGTAPVTNNASTFTILFKPTDASTTNKAAVVTIASNDPNTPSYTFDIGGQALSVPVASVVNASNTNVVIVSGSTNTTAAAGTAFGNVDEDNPVTHTFILDNAGSQPMTLAATPVTITQTGSDWSVASQPSSGTNAIPAGGTASFSITLSPSSVAAKSASIHIASNDSNSPYVFAVGGSGVSVPVIGLQGIAGTNSVTIPNGNSTYSTTNSTDFGSIELNNGIATETFVIQNNGSSAMSFSNTGTAKVVMSSGASDFTVVQQPTPSGNISPGGTAAIQIRFNPVASGVRTGVVSILTSDPVTHNFTFGIKGTAIRAGVIQVQGGTNVITAGNTSTATLNGTEFGNVDAMSSGVSHTFTIKNIGSDALNLLENTNGAAITFSGSGAAYFSIPTGYKPHISLSSGAQTNFNIAFNPSTNALGLQQATVTIASDTYNTNQASFTFAVEGTAITSAVAQVQGNGHTIANGDTKPITADGTDFGSTGYSNGFVTETFVINDVGSAALTFATNAVTLGTTTAAFSILTQPAASVAPGSSTTFSLKFSPSAAGVVTNNVSLASNDASSPYVFEVRGTGVTAPSMSVIGAGNNVITDGQANADTADGTDMGTVEPATGSATATFTIRNPGSSTLDLTATNHVSISGANAADFSVLTQPSGTVGAGLSSTFTILFKPTTVNTSTRTALVSIPSNDPNTSPYTFTVQGETQTQGVLQIQGGGQTINNGATNVATANDTNFGSVAANSGSQVETFILKNIGSAPLNLTGNPIVALSGAGANSGDFQVTTFPDTSVPLAVGATASVGITFTPTSATTEAATVTILDDDPTGTFAFNIQGTGH